MDIAFPLTPPARPKPLRCGEGAALFLGRGRIFLRLLVRRKSELGERALEESRTAACCSLSPRERVRVRGNTTNNFQNHPCP